MTNSDEYLTRRQARDLARRLARLERKQRSTAAAHADLRHSALDGGARIPVKDDQGNTTAYVGSGPTGIEHVDGPVPNRPEAPFVDAGQRVVKVQHSGLDVNDDPAPADLKLAEVHVSQDEVFEPSLSTLATTMSDANGSVTHSLSAGEWYVGIVWVTLSNQRSVMSEPVLADIEAPVDAQDIQDTLDTAQAKLDEYRDEVAAPRFEALETGLETNTTNLDDARTRLSEAESTLSPLPGRIESAEEDVATAQEEATKAAAAAVEANNRAMTRLANGNFESDLLYWDYENVSLTSTAHSGQQAAQITGWLRPGSSFPVVPDQIWELSLYHQYDVTVTFETADGDQRATLSTHHLDGDSTWSDSGTLRVTIPADVHMLSFTITGTSAIVDDITLRDVTDVVRLEEAANANRQKAEQAISELAVLQLAVDGEGGLRDRLDTAEDDLENIDTQLDQVATNLDTALTGPVDHDRLRVGEGAFDEAFVGELWAGNIRALAAELARAVIAAPNLIPGDHFSGQQAIRDDETNTISKQGDGTETYTDTPKVVLEAGETYTFTASAYANRAGTQFRVQLYNPDGSTLTNPIAQQELSTEPTKYEQTFTTTQTGGHYFRLYWNHPYGNPTSDDVQYLVNPRIQNNLDGNLLVENSITAEKIHATRELVTKIMGAEWAYVAEQLVVAGDLITNNMDAINAAIENLTVTERANFAEAFAQEMWAALAVFDRLQAEDAWITTAMVETILADKITVTEDFVANIASFIEIFADTFWANQAFIDRMAASEAYFGSEDADQSSRVDGTGMRITKHDHDNETSTDIVRLGGEGIGLVFADEAGEITGSLSHEGDASFRDVAVESLSLAGTPLLPPGRPVEVHNNNLWESQPKGLVCFHEEDMSGVSVDHNEYGFIEVNHPVRADRVYRVTTNNFLVDSSQHHYGRFRYTLGDGTDAPHTGSPQLGNTWVINRSEAGLTQTRGDHTFTPEHDGTIRILLCVARWTASSAGISFNNLSSMATAQLRLEDLGPARPYTGLTRNAGHGGIGTIRDPQPIGGATTTEWHASWYQTYSHNGTRQAASSTNPGGYGSGGPTQGINPNNPAQGVWSTLIGFGEGTNGQTLQQTLAGATVHSIILEVRGGASSSSSNHTRYFFYAQSQNSAPSTYTDNMRGYALLEGSTALVSAGQTRRISVPVDVFGPLLKSGDFQTLGLYALSTQLAYSGWLDWAGTRPKLIINHS